MDASSALGAAATERIFSMMTSWVVGCAAVRASGQLCMM
jgi:hypothetical protein